MTLSLACTPVWLYTHVGIVCGLLETKRSIVWARKYVMRNGYFFLYAQYQRFLYMMGHFSWLKSCCSYAKFYFFFKISSREGRLAFCLFFQVLPEFFLHNSTFFVGFSIHFVYKLIITGKVWLYCRQLLYNMAKLKIFFFIFDKL